MDLIFHLLEENSGSEQPCRSRERGISVSLKRNATASRILDTFMKVARPGSVAFRGERLALIEHIIALMQSRRGAEIRLEQAWRSRCRPCWRRDGHQSGSDQFVVMRSRHANGGLCRIAAESVTPTGTALAHRLGERHGDRHQERRSRAGL